MPDAAAATPTISCHDLTVVYGTLVALDHVSFDVYAGGVHALVGENGAGKSTWAKVMRGLITPREGTVRLHGRPAPLGQPRAMQSLGVEVLHQHFALVPSYTVAEALELQMPADRRHRTFSARALHRSWQAVLDAADLPIKAGTRIRDLGIEALQQLEIVRMLECHASVLIFDEPTAVLSPSEAARLMQRLRALAEQGQTVVLISHKIPEIMATATHATVLRGGRVAGSFGPGTMNQRDLVATIVNADPSQFTTLVEVGLVADAVAPATQGSSGAPLSPTLPHGHAPDGAREDSSPLARAQGEGMGVRAPAAPEPAGALRDRVGLHLEGVAAQATAGGETTSGLTLDMQASQITGIAGVEGNGQELLAELVLGLAPCRDGRILFAGQDLTRLSPQQRRYLGVRMIPFDRLRDGVSTSSPIWQNVALDGLLARHAGPLGLLSVRRVRAEVEQRLRRWHVVAGNSDVSVGTLSGGNIQRVILAREIDDACRVLIAAHPSRGLDIRATAAVHQALRDAAARGVVVLLISSDLDELVALSDVLYVMYGGRITAELRHKPFALSRIAQAMTGAAA